MSWPLGLIKMQFDIDCRLHSSFVTKLILTVFELVRSLSDKIQLKGVIIYSWRQYCRIILRTWVTSESDVDNEWLYAGIDNNFLDNFFGLNLFLENDRHLTHHDSAIHVLRLNPYQEQYHLICSSWKIPQIFNRIQYHL